MRRALIGCSSPLSYSYAYPIFGKESDPKSKPAPLLYGSTGLIILYDEIWFPCEEFCPKNMAGLSYVKFLNRDAPFFDFKKSTLDEDCRELYDLIQDPGYKGINLDELLRHSFGENFCNDARIDNHSRGARFLNYGLMGNADLHNLIIDTWLIVKYEYLNFDLVLNPLTARLGQAVFGEDGEPTLQYSRLELTKNLIRIDETFDIISPSGPYHPCLEELREDPNLMSFRKWMDGYTTKLDNQEIREINKDVNASIRNLTLNSIRRYVRRENLFNVLIDRVKANLLADVPPASTIAKIIEMQNKNKKAKNLEWQAYIATSRLLLREK